MWQYAIIDHISRKKGTRFVSATPLAMRQQKLTIRHNNVVESELRIYNRIWEKESSKCMTKRNGRGIVLLVYNTQHFNLEKY